MGQIFSQRRKSSTIRQKGKGHRKAARAGQKTHFDSLNSEREDGPALGHSRERLLLATNNKKNRRISTCDLPPPPRDNNNNVSASPASTLPLHQHATINDGAKDAVTNVKSVRTNSVFDGQGGGPSATNNTYFNEGYNHNSSQKSSLGTCPPQKSYYLDPPKTIYSDHTTVQSEPTRRPHHHHHNNRNHHRNRIKQSHHQHFGYEIKNVEEFLSKCSLLSPANIPVVLSTASVLYQTRPGLQIEIPLPLGMVVNGVFKIQQWLYVQTPHAEEGYVAYDSCLPLGILPTTRPTCRLTPGKCWETTDDLYPKPGLWTDSDQTDYLNTRSEGVRTPNCSEKYVDSLYLRAASQSNVDPTYSQVRKKSHRGHGSVKATHSSSPLVRETLLAVQMNFKSSSVSVKKGDVVTLLACKEIRDKNSKTPRVWFYVRTRNRTEAFIPAEVAGHGYL